MRGLLLTALATAGFAFCLGSALPASAAQRIAPANRHNVAVYSRVLRHANPQMPSWQSEALARRVLSNAAHWRIDPNILVAIVTVESDWHTHAVSGAGAIGLGQLMPGTAAGLGVDPSDPSQNLAGAAHYLSDMFRHFQGHPHQAELVFAAYNAGPKAVSEYGGIPPYYETQNYVVKVLRTWQHLRRTVHLQTLADDIPGGTDVRYWLNAETR